MRSFAIPLLASGLVLAACSNEPEQQSDTMTDEADMTASAEGVSTEDQMPLDDPAPVDADAEANRVYFALDSADLTEDGRERLDRIATAYEATPGTGVTLAGFTDTTGTRPYNEELSAERATAIQNYLVEQGIPASEMEVEAHGQSDLLVDTENNVAEPENRRVRVEFGDDA
ncbi:OmpA family protein [Pacificimonas sp. ICDLI1SI03]